MPTIPAGTKCHGGASTVDTKDRGSNNANNRREAYTIEDIAAATGGGALQVATLTLQGTTSSTTSQAIYGINVIDTATTSNLATRLPDPTTGKETTFVNNSTMSILVFPSVAGGKINGVVDGYASIPNDGTPYTFSCVQNPLPGAWTWSPPAVGQVQLPRISISHTFGSDTTAWGVGNAGAQLINPAGSFPSFISVSINAATGALTFVPNANYWYALPNLNPSRTIVNTKVYSNFLRSDTAAPGPFGEPIIERYFAGTEYTAVGGTRFYNNTAASKVYLANTPPSPYSGGVEIPAGPTNSPADIGDNATLYNIQPANTVHVAPESTDLIGDGVWVPYPVAPTLLPRGPFYHTFSIYIPADCATKTYEFDIFLEHT